jgi:chaperonin cofactor prefoldin
MAPNGVPMRFHKYYVSTLKKNCRREYRVARVIANLRNVSQQQKQALYNLLNERSRVRTDIDTAKKKARMYRLSGRALLAAKAEYKQNRAKLKKINKKLNFYMQVRTAADKRYVPFDIKALSWVFVVVLIGAFMGVYFFRENIIAYLTDLVANLPALFEKFGG